ncbi:MAG TPA: OmpA family protein, partial [Candidatus Bathyarchaeia archaeon]|jgi:hypothetical protein|nr:OmpA family protein [Candidatus Bathyarchaeia archaeon]
MRMKLVSRVLWFLPVICLCAIPALAQSNVETGKIKIHVDPQQAYVFVDDKAIRDGSQTIDVAAGDHKVGVYNYGYLPSVRTVHVGADETTDLRVALQSAGEMVKGPFAAIEFKGDPRAAVLLNGDTPAYFVGHVDEFNWNWIWHQRLLVKPGTYNVAVKHEGKAIWSGPVTAKAGQRTVVYLDRDGAIKKFDWKEGLTLAPQPRFHAGIASATVPIAPVEAKLAAQASGLTCGEPTTLNWSSADAVVTSISGLGNVSAKGTRSVTPMHDTAYVLTAKGPGGVATQSVTIDVDAQPKATLALSSPEIRYHKIGDKVVEQDTATLDWSASNANSATLTPFDSDAMSGSRTITAHPKRTANGPVNENVAYTFTAANACGGTTTKTATLHLVGSIDPPPAATLASVFYPTDYPTRRHPNVGLVASERMTLDNAATQFKNFGLYEHKASLVIVGYADVRGSNDYNMKLSERRAALVRDYLISKGVPAEDIQIRAEGETKQLNQTDVEALVSKNTPASDHWMSGKKRITWLAYNRRADLILEPTGQQSTRIYPAAEGDARLVWQLKKPDLEKVRSAANQSAVTQQASNHSTD